jgi:O-antigen/teichoic acid export membrane protein
VVVAREFGRSAETDGFFAAYGVFVVLSIVAGSVRVIAQPPLARARLEGSLGHETSAWAAALAVATVPLVVASTVFAGPVGDALTGSLPPEAAEVASETLVWLVPAAVLQLFAALAAGVLAALDDYGTAAAGYVVGSLAGLALILARVGEDGIVAVAWGAALNGAVAVAIPGLRLAWGRRPRGPAAGIGSRLELLVRGSVLPLVLQALYLVCLRMSTEIGVGELTSFSYAYLIASALVAVTATSLGLVTSVPLARAGLDDDAAARHVVGSSWLALALVAGAAGLFAVAGDALVHLVLGDAYEGGGIGALVVALSPWAVASIGVTLTYPLVFVRGRPRRVVRLALAVLLLHPFVVWLGREALGLDGVALALAASTALLLAGLLWNLGILEAAARGLALAAATVGALALLAFAPAALLAPELAAASLVAYAALLVLLRPSGLRQAWAYLRALR